MTETNTEKIIINNSEELKKHLYLPFDIEIPEFNKTLELTRDELDELKDKIIENIYKKDKLKQIFEQFFINKSSLTKITKEWEAVLSTDVKTEKLKRDVETQKTIKTLQETQNIEITSIDVSKSIEWQESKVKSLEFWLTLLIQRLALLWEKKSDLKDYTKLKDIFLKHQNNLDDWMKLVWNKMLEIFDKGSNSLKMYFVSNWPKIIDYALSQVKDVQEIVSSSNTWKKVWEENKLLELAKQHPALAWIAAVAWIYGLFKIIWGIFWWDNNKPSSWTEWKWFFDSIWWKWKWLIWWVLGMFGLGQAMWLEDVKKFFKEQLNFDIDQNRLLKAMQCFATWEIIDWFKVLFLWVDSLKEKPKKWDDFFKKVAEEINKTKHIEKIRWWINWEYIKKIWGNKTNDFLWFQENLIRWGSGLFWSTKDEKLHLDAFSSYLKESIKSKKIDVKANDTVEYTLEQIIWKDQSWSTTKEEKKNSEVTPPVPVSSEQWAQNNPTDNKEWSSLDNSLLYLVVKWTRFEVWKLHIRHSVRKYISSIEWKALWLAETKVEIKELESLEELLQKDNLSPKEKQNLESKLEKFLQKNPEILWDISKLKAWDLDSLISDPKLKAELIVEQEKLKQKAIDYHKEVDKLRKEKYRLVVEWETELRKLAEKDKSFFSSNRSRYSKERKNILDEIAKKDEQILAKNNWMNSELEISLKNTDELYKKHSLPEETKVKINKNLYGALGWLWVAFEMIPWVKTAKKVWKLGFIGLVSHTLISEWLSWDSKFKADIAEVWFGILPVTSEILDFKAAITWYDLAERPLTAQDRWMRAWFWVVWTVADLATILTLWWSLWLRAWLTWIKWLAKVAEVAWDAWKLSSIWNAVSDFSKTEWFIKTVKMANTWWKMLTFWALWIAIYDTVWDISMPNISEWAKSTYDKFKTALSLL